MLVLVLVVVLVSEHLIDSVLKYVVRAWRATASAAISRELREFLFSGASLYSGSFVVTFAYRE